MLHYHIVKICCNIYLLIALNGSKRKKKKNTNQSTNQTTQTRAVGLQKHCLPFSLQASTAARKFDL